MAEIQTNASTHFMFQMYQERLVRSGLPADIASVVSASKYAPGEISGLVNQFAAEQAAIVAELSAFNRIVAQDIANTSAETKEVE